MLMVYSCPHNEISLIRGYVIRSPVCFNNLSGFLAPQRKTFVTFPSLLLTVTTEVILEVKRCFAFELTKNLTKGTSKRLQSAGAWPVGSAKSRNFADSTI